jgi:hypothetical protein
MITNILIILNMKILKKISNSCIINEDDCHTSITSKINMQHYIFYFLLEFIKLNISENNNNNNTNNENIRL